MYADYQDFAGGFARRCRERRNAEEEQQRELDELTKPATAPSATDVRKSNGAGTLVHKTRDNACVADDDNSSVELTSRTRNVTATDASKMPWTDWVDARIEDGLDQMGKAVGQVIGTKARSVRDQLEQEIGPLKRELALLRHEFICLREDVALSRKLHDLHSEVAEARKQVPKLPAIVDEFDARQTDLEAEQTRLERELAKTKERVSKMRVDQSVDHFSISQLEKAAAKTTASIEMETSTSRFVMRNIHPDVAKALREFASQVVDAEDGGAIWGRCLIQCEATTGTA